MTILQINKFFYKKGGSESYLFALTELLRKKGHTVSSFSMKDPRNEHSEQAQFFVENIDFKKGNIFSYIKKAAHVVYSFHARFRMSRLLSSAELPDIVHAHNIARQLSPSIFTAIKKKGIPIVQTLHDFQLVCPNNKMYTQQTSCQKCKKHKYWNCVRFRCEGGSLAQSMLAALELSFHSLFRLYRRVDMFIAPSQFLKDRLIAWGVSEKKITVIPNFVDCEKYTPLYQSDDYFVYVGRVIQEKGLQTLLDAMHYLQGSDVKMKIVGTGPFETAIRAYIKQYDLQNIEIVGYQAGEKLTQLIAKAKFVVLPSLLEEIYPISLLESAALGIPAIASDRGGIPEVVVNNETGFIMDSDDPIAWAKKIQGLYGNPELITRMGSNARKKAERDNNPDEHYKKLMQVYTSLLEK